MTNLVPFRTREETPLNTSAKPVKPNKAINSQVIEHNLKAIQVQLNRQPQFLAGGLSRHLRNWQTLTSDQTILNIVRGFKLDLMSFPKQSVWPKHLLSNRNEIKTATILLQELLHKQVIEETTSHPNGFMSNIFLREKKTGSHRVILNLKPLNEHVQYLHFKMTTLSSALELVTPNCFMASIDLADAYYSVNVREDNRKFLQFNFQNKTYRFTCLANGISSAPRTFTK